MRIIAVLSTLLLSITSSLSVTVSFDAVYDNGSASLNTVACSDGANGLLTKGFSTFDSLPSFPFIGGTQNVTGWNSDRCGTCWALKFNGKTIHVLAVDHTNSGFNIAQAAMDELTNHRAVAVGRVDAAVRQVEASACGLR